MAFCNDNTNEAELATPYWAQFIASQNTSLLTDDMVQAQHATHGTLADHGFCWSYPVHSDIQLLPHHRPSPASVTTPTNFSPAFIHPLELFDRPNASLFEPATYHSALHVCTASSGTLPPTHSLDAVRAPTAQLRHRKRRFESPTCNRVFHFPKDLRRHETTHSKFRPFKCLESTCKYHIQGFPRKDNWSRHMRREHPNIDSSPADPAAVSTSETLRFD